MAKMHSFDGWMGSVGEYLYAHVGEILAMRSRFLMSLNLEPTVLILPPLMAMSLEQSVRLTAKNTIIWYGMAVICGDVEEPTLGFGVSQWTR